MYMRVIYALHVLALLMSIPPLRDSSSGFSSSFAAAQRCTIGAVSLRFKPLSAGPPFSFLHQNLQANVTTMRSRVFPPIIVQVLDSNGNVDVSEQTQDIRIVITSTARLASTGSSVSVAYGEAHILDLLVEGTDPTYNLTFTAQSASAYRVSTNASSTALTIRNVASVLVPVNVFALVFARNSTFVMYNGQPITIVFGQVVPQIMLNVVNSQYLTYPTSSTLGSSYTVQAVPSDQRISVIRGGTAAVLDGEALFDDLVLSGASGVSIASFSSISFVLYDATTPTDKIASTGLVTVAASVVEYSEMMFERQDTSFISSQGQVAYATAGVQLAPIRISIRSNILTRSPATSGLIITATCRTPSEYPLAGSQVGVINGIATFTNLSFDSRVSGRISIAFQAGSQGSLPVAQKVIHSGWITVVPAVSKASMLRFLPNAVDSYINYPGQNIEAVLFSPIPPVRIQILDSSYAVDDTTTVLLTAKASNGVQFISTTKQAEGGIVEFSTLQFTSSSNTVSPRITFTATAVSAAGSSSATTLLPLLGARLVSGVVTVAAVQANYDLRFQPYGTGLFVTQGQPSVGTINIPLPIIVVELITSAGTTDASSSDISVTASSSGATLSGNFLRVTNGVAIFDTLMFVSETPGSYVLTFTAGREDATAAVGGKSISTGILRIASGVTPAFALRFARDSAISYAGQVVPIPLVETTTTPGAEHNNVLRNVVIELIDSAHNVSTSTRPIVIALPRPVGTRPSFSNKEWELALEMKAFESRVVWKKIGIESGYATVLTFTAKDTVEAVNGQSVSSGSLSVRKAADAALPAFLDIVASGSTAAARTATSINSGAAMTFRIQIMNAVGGLAQTVSTNYSVTASSSIPLKTPLVRDVNGAGAAVFSALQFAQTVPRSALPIITFTASVRGGSGSSSGSGGTLLPILATTTGLITVVGPSLESGVDVVAQILFDYSGFKPVSWIASVARRLNVETSRFLVTRVYYGTSADPVVSSSSTASGVASSSSATSPSSSASISNAINITSNVKAVWYGTRLDFRVLEPLATSRNTKPAWMLVNYILNIKTSCAAAPDLYLRKTMNLSSDTTCDWFMFEDQMSSAQQCSLATGVSTAGFCECYVPVVASMGMRCLGYRTLTDLCLNTLLGEAQCVDPRIVRVCTLLQEEPVPRVMLLASGILFGFLLIPLLYLKSSGFFHKLQRPEAHASFATVEKIRIDESELL